MSDELWSALALVLIIEGVLPFVAPNLWRATFLKLTRLTDGQLRLIPGSKIKETKPAQGT